MIRSLFLVVALFMSTFQGSLAVVGCSSQKGGDQSFDRLQHFVLKDGVPAEEHYGYTAVPKYQPLEIHESDDSEYEYMAHSLYYTVYFKEKRVKMSVKNAWIAFELGENLEIKAMGAESKGENSNIKLESVAEQNSLSVLNVFESVDLLYTVDTSLLTEVLTVKEPKEFERVVQRIFWEGVTPEFQEDRSIVFLDEDEIEILKILPPFIEDAEGSVCTDLHYELIEIERGYELHKVIDEEGLKWLEQAIYPVIIDPSMQTFEDAWESSGLTPYGQYSQNLREYVNPANGSLTVTQTDLVIPGRGLDLVVSRVYQTPAVFYGANPYDYESPPVNVGNGWQLNFPYIGDKYLHLWGGTVYQIEWVGNTFENHKGSHFILVENGDNTYTLTTAGGIVYEFSTEGKLTEINDLDQNTITFNYTSGELTSITDTIGRTVSFSYSSNRLQKITYNSAEIEYSYDGNGCLQWMEDFLDRRTSYYYNTGYNNWLLSKITYATTGYTTYAYNRFSNSGYYKYLVTDQRVYETSQVRHSAFSYTGSFEEITSSTATVKNESDVTKGSYQFTISDGLITQGVVKNALGTPIRKCTYTYNSSNEVTEESVYNDGSTLSYTNYYSYDDWGNCIYSKNAEGHEKFFSYANTDTSGFFVDNNDTIIKEFTNAFSNSTVPSSIHTVLLGTAEKQDNTYVREAYLTYDSEAHPTQSESAFGNATTWLTFSGTFNEKTGQTSFPIDLTGYTVSGNGVLEITGLPSDDTYQESHSTNCPGTGCMICNWLSYGSGWSNKYYTVHWLCSAHGEPDEGYKSIDHFTHYPGTLGYQSYTTIPALDQLSTSFTVKTYWKAYPVQVKYNLDSSSWTTITSSLQNTTAHITVPITDGSHTLYFDESFSKQAKFSWYLYVPVDNTPDTYTTSMQYDTYGNVTSITDAESNTISLTYSSSYSSAYLTEISATVGTDTITTKATYDYYRGWITSIQQPKGVATSGYDTVYTYDVLGRIMKKEFPLLPGQSERSCIQAVYDCENRKVTIIDPLGHYIVKEHDNLGRLTSVKSYTGEFGTGTLYATTLYTYDYNDQVKTVTDPQNHTTVYTYDFLGRLTHVLSPDSSTVSYLYDDTNNKMTFTNGREYDRVFWFDWLNRLTKVEEEYTTDSFAVTTYQYDEANHLTSLTDAETRTTSYTYGSLFGITQVTYPDSTYEEYAYDNAGNITSFTDANGNETQLSYDTLYRLIQIQYQDQSTISFSYDSNSNRTRMDDNSPDEGDYSEYEYDHWNRLTTEMRHILTEIYTVSYQYDAASRLTKLTYPDDMQILYSYDDLNRTTEIKRYVDGSNDEILLDGVQYDTESLLTQFDYGNDLQATFSYDSRDRLSTLDVKNGTTSYIDLDYTYDNSSNITQLVNGWRDSDLDWHSQTESYRYDGLDRLTTASCTSWSHTYLYDKVGNRTGKDSLTYTINAVNEVTSLSDSTSFLYDANGNRTQKTKGSDTWVYSYDYANRLTRVEKNSETLGEYVYDGDGKRIQVTEDSETTTYIYSGLNVLYEENTTGTAAYIYGPTGRLAKKTTISSESNTFYYHTDHQGSTRLVTDESKTVVTDVTYEPFGESTAPGEESYLYTGKEIGVTGLYYYGARYYDPETGRFITRDPLAGKKVVPQSLNRYTYCLNNPVTLIDPAGLTYKICDVNSGVCIRIDESPEGGWTAYDSEDNIITNSSEMETLISSDNPADKARAVYLMLLITHPEISGDPGQYQTEPAIIENDATLFDYEVDINGEKKVIRIGISTEPFKLIPDARTGKMAKVYAITRIVRDGRIGKIIEMKVFQYAFLSVARLFHIIGHEGVHVIDLLSGEDYNQEEMELRAMNWNRAHSGISLFPWTFFPPFTVRPEIG